MQKTANILLKTVTANVVNTINSKSDQLITLKSLKRAVETYHR